MTATTAGSEGVIRRPAVFFYSRHRTGFHPERHLHGFAGILQADAYAGFNRLYETGRKPGSIIEAACWRMRGASYSCWPMSLPRRAGSFR